MPEKNLITEKFSNDKGSLDKDKGLFIKNQSKCPKGLERTKRPRVLFVEDNEIIQRIYVRFLEELNCEVTLISTGQEAISEFDYSYDMVLLDIGLPDINGMEVCRLIRSQNIEIRVPIVFLTAYGDSLREDSFDAGGDDFLVKPIDTKDLSRLLNKWVFRKVM